MWVQPCRERSGMDQSTIKEKNRNLKPRTIHFHMLCPSKLLQLNKSNSCKNCQKLSSTKN